MQKDGLLAEFSHAISATSFSIICIYTIPSNMLPVALSRETASALISLICINDLTAPPWSGNCILAACIENLAQICEMKNISLKAPYFTSGYHSLHKLMNPEIHYDDIFNPQDSYRPKYCMLPGQHYSDSMQALCAVKTANHIYRVKSNMATWHAENVTNYSIDLAPKSCQYDSSKAQVPIIRLHIHPEKSDRPCTIKNSKSGVRVE